MSNKQNNGLSWLAGFVGLGAVALPGLAQAQEPIPNVLPKTVFIVDGGADMLEQYGTSGFTKFEVALDAIDGVIRNALGDMDFAVVVTEDEGFRGEVPFNQDRALQLAAIGSITPPLPTDVSTVQESYQHMLADWLTRPHTGAANFSNGPFEYDCSTVNVIYLGAGELSFEDHTNSYGYTNSITPDVTCEETAGDPSTDNCRFDNVAAYANNTDLATSIAGTQIINTYTVLLGEAAGAPGEPLYINAAFHGGGTYHLTDPGVYPQVEGALWTILGSTFEGVYARSGPVISVGANRLFQAFYEVQGGHPLFRGHLRAFALEDDPSQPNFGEIVLATGPGGALWDAGDLLASRPANPSELNQFPGHNNAQQRTIWTHYDGVGFHSPVDPFDSFGVSSGNLVDVMLPPGLPLSDPTSVSRYDYNEDGIVDATDAQVLVDFLRGVHTSTFLSTGQERGNWKLGDTDHGKPVHAPNRPAIVTNKPDFAAFLLELANEPSMVYLPANDGMLHAFGTGDTFSAPDHGVEWWAYVPRNSVHWDNASLYTEDDHQSDRQMLIGQTRTNDGQCTLDFVHMDGVDNGIVAGGVVAADGQRSPDGSEWHRILVCSMGGAQPYVYALDVTNPALPRFLWEHADMDAQSGPGQGLSYAKPVIGVVFDPNGGGSGVAQDRWVVFMSGGGKEDNLSLPASLPFRRDELTNATHHYMIDVLDHDRFDGEGYSVPNSGAHTPSLPGNFLAQWHGGDSVLEYAPTNPGEPLAGVYGTPSAVDIDSDGAIDALYIGARSGHVYKALLVGDPDDPTICEFHSPGLSLWDEPSMGVWYSPSVSFDQDGSLKVFFGTGSPYAASNTFPGRFYAKIDPNPYGCVPAVDNSACYTGGERLLDPGERLVGSPLTVAGSVYFTTYVPGTDACDIGDSRVYGLSITNCQGTLPNPDPAVPGTVDSIEQPGLASELAIGSNGAIYVSVTDGAGNVEPLNPINPTQEALGEQSLDRFFLSTWRDVYGN